MHRTGFSLIEVMMASALIFFVTSLGFVAIQTSSNLLSLNNSRALLQNEAKGLMVALTREVEAAVKPAATGKTLPPGAQGFRVMDDGRSIQFQIPTDDKFTAFSAPITIRFENEDRIDAQYGPGIGNARLEPGEDINGDGALTRRLTRTEAGNGRILGGANHIANVLFELLDNNNTLRVNFLFTAPAGNLKQEIVRFNVTQDIYLMN